LLYYAAPSPRKTKKVAQPNQELTTETPEKLPDSQPISCDSWEDNLDKDLLSNAKPLQTHSLSESSPSASTSKINEHTSGSISPRKPAGNQGNKDGKVPTPSKTITKDSKDKNSANNDTRNIFDDIAKGGHSLQTYSLKDTQKSNMKAIESARLTKLDPLPQKSSSKSPIKMCSGSLVQYKDDRAEGSDSKDKLLTPQKSSKVEIVRKSKQLEQKSSIEEVITQVEYNVCCTFL